MPEFNIMEESASGAGVTQTVTVFAKEYSGWLAIGGAILVVALCVVIYKCKYSEGLANPTSSLKMMKRDDYGTREGMASGSDNAADQSQSAVAASVADDDGCAVALADKSDKEAWEWMSDKVRADNSQEPMASRPKSDNDFSKILVGQ